jgi:adhesin transport system membrane fusion protein
MLNLSENTVEEDVDFSTYESTRLLERKVVNRLVLRIVLGLFIASIAMLFVPWTQNIQAKGYVTTLYPEDRPQVINSIIAGKITKWYVKEGDFVRVGDTILTIGEVKTEYLDPELVLRAKQQMESKIGSVDSYNSKISSLDKQLKAFDNLRILKEKQALNKLKQSKLKVISDSNDLIAFQAQLTTEKKQLKRTEELHHQGLKSLTEVETKRLKVQEWTAKVIAQENKLLTSQNDVLNARVEISNVENEYNEKLAKTESDQFSALSDKFESAANAAKLQNEYSNYVIRKGLYVIRAAQTGYVTKLIRSGIGETIKEGEQLVTIMPHKYNLAVEFYIDPVDYPLVKKGEKVQMQFDGWPAIFFSGWPNTTYGTFTGEIYAIDNYISENGQYRILVKPYEQVKKWPKEIRVGGGAKTFVLLHDVPIWYELWRKMNGFPPDYYVVESEKGMNKKSKDKEDEK